MVDAQARLSGEVPLIAVVDQDSAFLNLVGDLLDRNGYRTLMLNQPDVAHQEIKTAGPQLIVMDLAVDSAAPAWRELEMLRLDPETVRIPVIVCSVASEVIKNSKVRLADHGCDLLLKPFDFPELLNKVRRFVGPAK